MYTGEFMLRVMSEIKAVSDQIYICSCTCIRSQICAFSFSNQICPFSFHWVSALEVYLIVPVWGDVVFLFLAFLFRPCHLWQFFVRPEEMTSWVWCRKRWRAGARMQEECLVGCRGEEVTRKNKNCVLFFLLHSLFFCVPFSGAMPFSNLISFLPVSTHFLHMEVCSHVVAHSEKDCHRSCSLTASFSWRLCALRMAVALLLELWKLA